MATKMKLIQPAILIRFLIFLQVPRNDSFSVQSLVILQRSFGKYLHRLFLAIVGCLTENRDKPAIHFHRSCPDLLDAPTFCTMLLILVVTIAFIPWDTRTWANTLTRGYGMNPLVNTGDVESCGFPTPGFVKWSLVRSENFRKANARHRDQRYVIVMTDGTHAWSDALIVIRTDRNLNSRDRVNGNS